MTARLVLGRFPITLAIVTLISAFTGAKAFCAETGSAGEEVNSKLWPTKLKCEYSTDPLGIDEKTPRLFWELKGCMSVKNGCRQGAYRILAASSREKIDKDEGDLWDSGRVESDRTTQIPYEGKTLTSSQKVFWKVRGWDEKGRPLIGSRPATWTMGLLEKDDWKGKWICAPAETESLLLRHEFNVKPGLRRAVVHVAGLGQYELRFNGKKAGDDLFTPGWTDYDETILYDTYDVTEPLREGANAVGMILGNGMYHVVRRNRFAKFKGSFGPLRAIVHLRLEYGDGSVEFVGTDDAWRCDPGPITYNSIYGGEDYDARLEQAGWDAPGFDDSNWNRTVEAVRPGRGLQGHRAGSEPIRIFDYRKPMEITEMPGVFPYKIYDLGQNASYLPRLKVAGPAGSTVRIIPAETLLPDGRINRRTTGKVERGINWWQYTKATDGEEEWTPHFFYTGCRYFRVDCYPPGAGAPPPPLDFENNIVLPPAYGKTIATGAPPEIVSLSGLTIHSTARPVGNFETSNPRLNQIRELVRWAQRSNMVSVLTDCPHREKLGWIEQYHLNGPAIRYEFDVTRIFSKAMHDMADAQTDEGMVPNTAPEYVEFKGAFRSAAEWGAAFIAVPWQQYLFTGDASLFTEYYDEMERYFAYLESRAKDGILTDGLGDWYDVGPKRSGRPQHTPPPVTATAFYYQDAALLAKIAGVIGRERDARKYNEKAASIRAAWRREFYHAGAGVFATGSQCSNALALEMGLAESAERDAALAALVADLESNGYATTAGDIGYRYVLLALAHGGRSDVVLEMLLQNGKPGYGWQLDHGATALTEAWDANQKASHNHFMLGQVTEWFYAHLAGIQPDPEAPGFKRIVIRPGLVEEIDWVEASYVSIHGKIVSRWERTDGVLRMEITIPPNTTASVYLPADEGAAITESGIALEAAPGVTVRDYENGRMPVDTEPGRYRFEIPMAQQP